MNIKVYKSVSRHIYSGFLLIKNLSSDFNSLNGVFIITLILVYQFNHNFFINKLIIIDNKGKQK